MDGEDLERALYLARKRMERNANPGFSIPSASSRSVVYKGLYTASRIAEFYWDLRDPDFETAYGLFHQRFSTNTFPSWENAQPFRALAHNGEINTIQSNRSWMPGSGRATIAFYTYCRCIIFTELSMCFLARCGPERHVKCFRASTPMRSGGGLPKEG